MKKNAMLYVALAAISYYLWQRSNNARIAAAAKATQENIANRAIDVALRAGD